MVCYRDAAFTKRLGSEKEVSCVAAMMSALLFYRGKVKIVQEHRVLARKKN